MIRLANEADLNRLTEIEAECFPHSSWRAEHFLAYDCVVAEVNREVAGFLVSRESFAGKSVAGGYSGPPEREILNLAVASAFRRTGVATALLRHELERQATFFLEVRVSNLAARNLYHKLGFYEVGRRPFYYEDPAETAIVMQRKR